MRKGIIYALAVLTMCAFSSQKEEIIVRNTSFGKGEVLAYRVHYGFINAGTGTMQVSDKYYEVNGKTCFKVNIYGKSSKGFSMLYKVRDNWRSYIDTSSLQPEKSFRDIVEGNYELKETTFYYKEKSQIKVHRERKNKDPKNNMFDVPEGVHDVVSGYYYLRNIDYSNLEEGDIVKIDAFLEDELFDFKVRYRGKDVIDTRFGDVHAIKLEPIMPDNSYFDGEDSVLIWLSDDENKVPLIIQAKMFIGKIELELKGYKNIKSPLNKA